MSVNNISMQKSTFFNTIKDAGSHLLEKVKQISNHFNSYEHSRSSFYDDCRIQTRDSAATHTIKHKSNDKSIDFSVLLKEAQDKKTEILIPQPGKTLVNFGNGFFWL